MVEPTAEMPKRGGEERGRRWRVGLLVFAALFSFLFGLGGVGEPLEDLLRGARNLGRQHPASGDIVIAAIDDRSLEKMAQWPWPRRYHAQAIEKLHNLGADRIFVDIDFSSKSEPSDDEALYRALQQANRSVTLLVRFVDDSTTGVRSERIPLPNFRKEAELAHINLRYNYRGEVWTLPYSLEIGGQEYPSFASKLAKAPGDVGESFPVDYSVNPSTIPVLSMVDILEGRVGPEQVAGKTIILGATSAELGDQYLLPGYGYMSGVYLHVLGAETLKAGEPVGLGWFAPFCLALLIVGGLAFAREIRAAIGCAATFAVFILAPFVLEQELIFVDVVPSLFLLLVVGVAFGWSRFQSFYRLRGSLKAVSGLPNFNALRHDTALRDNPLIVMRIKNYPEIMSMLSEAEDSLVRQIVKRLTVVSVASEVYQGDEGLFAWFANPSTAQARGEHLDALYEIFRNPFVVQGRFVDPAVTFGVDIGTSRTVSNRLGSALFAADEALREGLKWKQYDPSTRADASWKLSLLSQLDQAIDSGQLSIAYQPKLEISSGRIVGAEALVRWHHPEKGTVNPADFILAAEQSGRIEKLTQYVLRTAIQAAATANANGNRFNIAVNLSARLITDSSLPETISKLLREHRLPADRLTLEITETAALAGVGTDLELLMRLREMGVELSIDDYGTGMSTLAYLQRIPATEIKIDKSFIQSIETSHSDRLLVASTIQLAHSLGQKVVAEGVEREETLKALTELECDLAQGYLIGRPMSFALLERRLMAQRKAA
jgi:EAL domain-containing protein (putative c-di-GMP-specific phosphodiesterase class I)/CHASE2 domain-containing sensor protein